jgi:transposase
MARPVNHVRNRAWALEIAALRRQGLLLKQIAYRLGVSQSVVSQRLKRGCPMIWEPPPLVPRRRPPLPWWKPDSVTLRLVRQARAEMAENARAGIWFNPPE